MIKKGFTLVELLAVFVLLAIIFMIAVPNVFKLISKGKSNAFLVSVRQVYKAGNIYRLNELREREEECVYFDFGEDYQIDTLVKNKMYIPIEELELQGDLPKEGVMEVCQDFVSITVSDGDNTVDIGPDGDEHVFDGNLEESNVSRPVIDNISTSKTTKSITVTVKAHDDKNDIVKYYYYLNGELKQSINNNVYEFTNIKDNTNYKIKIVVENGKGLKTSQNINVKTDEVPSPEITVNKTGWQSQKTVTITYPSPSVNNFSHQYKINSGETTKNYEKDTWITASLTSYNRFITITYTSEGSVSAKVSDGFNEKVVTYNVIEVDGVKPEVTIEPTIVEGENGWVTMASIKGTITKKGKTPVKLYRCRSYSSSSCAPRDSEDNIVEDGSSLVLTNIFSSTSVPYQRVCYQAISETGMKSETVCSDSYKVDTGPEIGNNEILACLEDELKDAYKDAVSWGPSRTGTIENCKMSDTYNKEIGGYEVSCDVKGNNGKIVNKSLKISPIGCYVNYNPDNPIWDTDRDGVGLNNRGIFNIYDEEKETSANGLSKNESLTCYTDDLDGIIYGHNEHNGWRIMNVDSETGQITLVHGGTPECYYLNYSYQGNQEDVKRLSIIATSIEDEGEGKAWTKYGNNELALSVHYMDRNDFDKCPRSSHLELTNTNSFYYLANNGQNYAGLSYYVPLNKSYKISASWGIRPVIILKPNVKLGQESGLKGDEYSLITS